MAQTARKSNLDLINEADGFDLLLAQHPDTLSKLYLLRINHQKTEYNLGYIQPEIARKLWKLKNEVGLYVIDYSRVVVVKGDTAAERSANIAQALGQLREMKTFEVLAKWRDELYPVYGPDGELLFSMERSASPLFGIVTYGVHMTAYTRDKATGEMRIWVPRRARTKQTYGGMLDNTVAGGIATGEAPFESLVREAMEEASLPEDVVKSGAKAVGAVTYFYVRDERAGGEIGVFQPECEYVYDLELPEGIVPKPLDGEVEEFYHWTILEVQEAMARGEFKPNCALVFIDFFVRHGILTYENEPHYTKIVQRLHRELPFPMP